MFTKQIQTVLLLFTVISESILVSSNHDHCLDLPGYTAIQDLVQTKCLSVTQVWGSLKVLAEKDRTCLGRAIHDIAEKTSPNNNLECVCKPYFPKQHIHPLHDGHDNPACFADRNCQDVFHFFYLTDETFEESNCVTHNFIWKKLAGMGTPYRVDVLADSVYHLADTFKDGNQDVCTCKPMSSLWQMSTTMAMTSPTTSFPVSTTQTAFVPMTTKPHITHAHSTATHTSHARENSTSDATIHSKTTAKTTVSATTETTAGPGAQAFSTSTEMSKTTVTAGTEATTTVSGPGFTFPDGNFTTGSFSTENLSHCEVFDSLYDLSKHLVISHPDAYTCAQTGEKTSSEAFVLANCHLPPPAQWREGPNVMQNCLHMPMYTPIATFGVVYLGEQEHVGLSGIFIQCTDTGFLMAAQRCDTAADIVFVSHGEGPGPLDPNAYYAIL